MLRTLFLKSIRDQQRSLPWWIVGIVGISMMTILFYPSLADMPGLDDLTEQLPEALLAAFAGEFSDFTSPAGFLNSQLFFFLLPLVFMFFAIAGGSSAIAGEEERGTLDLLLANPIPRWRIVVEKFAAIIVLTLVLAFALFLALAIGALVVDMDIGLLALAQVTTSVFLLAAAFGSLSLALGCLTGKRGLSIGLSAGIGLGAYFLNAMAPLVHSLEGYRVLSPFYYYIGADPLANGLNAVHVLVLLGLITVPLAVAVWGFGRRDLAV